MQFFETGNLGRTVVIQLTRGDKVIESIDKALKEAGISSAVMVSGIGSLQKLHFHWPLDTGPEANDEYTTVEGPIEVGVVSGSYINGIGHYHFVAGDQDNAYIGHLEPDTEVLYLAEFIFAELKECNLERRFTPQKVRLVFPKDK